jgi:hypothetical protein
MNGESSPAGAHLGGGREPGLNSHPTQHCVTRASCALPLYLGTVRGGHPHDARVNASSSNLTWTRRSLPPAEGPSLSPLSIPAGPPPSLPARCQATHDSSIPRAAIRRWATIRQHMAYPPAAMLSRPPAGTHGARPRSLRRWSGTVGMICVWLSLLPVVSLVLRGHNQVSGDNMPPARTCLIVFAPLAGSLWGASGPVLSLVGLPRTQRREQVSDVAFAALRQCRQRDGRAEEHHGLPALCPAGDAWDAVAVAATARWRLSPSRRTPNRCSALALPHPCSGPAVHVQSVSGEDS